MQDTLIDLAELALRYFEREFSKAKDIPSFVNIASDQLGMKGSLGMPWEDVRRNASRYSVAQAFTVFDTFCRRLSSEFRLYHRLPGWRKQIGKSTLDSLAAIAENMAHADQRRVRMCPEYDVLQYYREVRNRVLHATEDDTDRLRASLVSAHTGHLLAAYGALPARYEAISYEDYFLLTRATKYFAAVLNDGCALTAPLVMDQLFRDDDFLKILRKRKGNANGLDRLVGFVQRQYGIPPSDGIVIRACIDRFLLTDPPHQVRRRLQKGAT